MSTHSTLVNNKICNKSHFDWQEWITNKSYEEVVTSYEEVVTLFTQIYTTNQKRFLLPFILKDGRVDPSDNYNHAIRHATYSNYVDIVETLLQDTRVLSILANWVHVHRLSFYQ